MPGLAGPDYRLAIADLGARHLEVELKLDGPFAGPVRLWMPAWVPGSYLMREYAGQIISLNAFAGKTALDAQKLDKLSWQVDPAGHKSIRVLYRVYAPELTVRTNDVTHDHAFINPAGAFLAVEGREDLPARLEVVLPKPDWSTYVALPQAKDGSYQVADYDTLVDSPLELGPMPMHVFEAAGVRHELVIEGEGNFEIEEMKKDMTALIECEAELFGGLPEDMDRYLFILLLTESGMGGLEHKNSTALAWPQLGFRPRIEYDRYLTLVAHEYFHVWNVKRIRPEVLLQYDYKQEVYTRLLWAFEGITNYYDELLPVRADVYPAKRYLEFTAENIRAEWARPGHAVQSISDSSFDTWIKLYRPTPDSQNTQVSYYQRGMLVALLLDLRIRRESGDKKSLDDVMRYLWTEVYLKGQGVREGGYAEIVHAATGIDVAEYLDGLVEGTAKLDYEEALGHVGLRLRVKESKEDETEPAWLGAVIQKKEGHSVLSTVHTGGSALMGGLMAGDVLLALDGLRVGLDLEARLKLYRTGETVSWAAFRRGRLVQGELQFLENPYPPMELVPTAKPSAKLKKSFEAWTGAKWDFEG